MAKKQRYSLRKIRSNYTYSIYEIAELYGLTSDTVFRWIRDDGLKRIGNFRKYLVHSSDLLEFLENRNSQNKQPCKDGEIFCCKCKKPKKPNPLSMKVKTQPNKTIKVSGKCSVCGTAMTTYVSGKKWSIKHPFHPNKNEPIKLPSGEHISPRECQTRKVEQLCLNLTP